MKKLLYLGPYSLCLKVQCTPLCSYGHQLWVQMRNKFHMVSYLRHSCWLQCWEALSRHVYLPALLKLRVTCKLSLSYLLPLSLSQSWQVYVTLSYSFPFNPSAFWLNGGSFSPALQHALSISLSFSCITVPGSAIQRERWRHIFPRVPSTPGVLHIRGLCWHFLAFYYEDEIPIHPWRGTKHDHELLPYSSQYLRLHCPI